jgi:hypothetical protein
MPTAATKPILVSCLVSIATLACDRDSDLQVRQQCYHNSPCCHSSSHLSRLSRRSNLP